MTFAATLLIDINGYTNLIDIGFILPLSDLAYNRFLPLVTYSLKDVINIILFIKTLIFI